MRIINKFKICVILIFFFIISSNLFNIANASETPDVKWNKFFGGKRYDAANKHIQTIDGGYAIVGSTNSIRPRGHNFWFVKTYPNGSMEWSKSYGGSGDDFAYDIIQTNDSGFLIIGSTTSFDIIGDFDILLIRTNITGHVEWYQTYGNFFDDHATSIINTKDGGYAIAAITNVSDNNDFLLIKINSKGRVEWSKNYGDLGDEEAWSVIQTHDDGYAITGAKKDVFSDNNDFWFVKTDQHGNMIWNKTYGGEDEDIAYSIIQTNDDGYAIAGETRSYGLGSYDIWLVKTDKNGSISWNRTFGGKDEDSAYSIIQAEDSGYLLGGFTENMLYYDSLIVKTNSFGYLQWSKNFSLGTDEKAYSLIKTTDDNYSMAGHSQSEQGSDFFIFKTNNSNLNFSNLFPIADSKEDKTGIINELIFFNGTGFDPDGNINFYRWDFDGDGIFDFESNKTGAASFVYNKSGDYRAFFEVTDNNGSISIDMAKVIVGSNNIRSYNDFSQRDIFIIILISILLLCIILLYYISKNEKIKNFIFKKLSFLNIDIWFYKLTFSFFIIVFLKLIYSYFINSPWIYFDEPSYAIIAHDIFQGEFNLIAESLQSHPYPTGYPYLLAPTYILGDNMYVVFQGMLFVNCIISTLIIFPVFFIMKNFISNKKSFYTSIVVAVTPGILIYNFFIMSENAFYLVFLIICLLVIKSFTYKKIDKFFIFYLIILGLLVRYLILIKTTGFAILGALFFVILYKIIRTRKKNSLLYIIPVLPSLPAIFQLLSSLFQEKSTISVIGYEASSYIEKQITVTANNNYLFDFLKVILNEISYFVLMSYIICIVFVFYLVLNWNRQSVKKRQSISYFAFFSFLSILFLIIITTIHIYKSRYDIYTRYVNAGIPIVIMLGIIGISLYYDNRSDKSKINITILFILSCLFVIFTFPINQYKIVNNLDLVWITYLQKQILFGLDFVNIFFIILGLIAAIFTYLIVIKVCFHKDFLFNRKPIKQIYLITALIIISLIIFIPNIHMNFVNGEDIKQRNINGPAQWLMENSPESIVLMDDSYSAFSGGGMAQDYWDFMYADMRFWLPNSKVYVVSKEALNQIIQLENSDFDYILSTHDLSSKYRLIEIFDMNIEPLKRQNFVDWHIYE